MVFTEDDEMGWIKLHRKIMRSGVWGNPVYLMVWTWCLFRANVRDVVVPFNGQDIHLRRGQFITGRKKAVLEMPISEQNYRTAIEYLKSTSRITIQVTNRFSIITVVKYNDYQDNKKEVTSQLTIKSPATNQPLTTDKNYKNYKKIPSNDEENTEMQNATPIRELLRKNRPSSVPPPHVFEEISRAVPER